MTCWTRRGGNVHDPLVMAGLGAHRDRGGEPRPRALCEKLPAYASPLLLYAEEIEPRAGWHLGNFPQAFSHLALINACVHLIREDERIAAG
jgi:GH15 family glucan-1,4-alpha-glucosidase